MRKKSSRRPFGILSLFILVVFALLIASCKSGGEDKRTPPSDSASAAKPASGDFEGTITMAMTGAGTQGATVTYYIKGARARMETTMAGHSGAENAMLWDQSGGKVTTLFIPQKTFMTMDIDTMRAQAQARGGATSDSQSLPKLTDTGKDETVAGYPCHDWIIGDKQEIQACVAKGLGAFGMAGNQGAGGLLGRLLSPKLSAEAAANPDWKKMTEGGGFPLKTVLTENGKPSFTMEATTVERKKIDDSLLVIPPDYKPFEAPKIPGIAPPKQ